MNLSNNPLKTFFQDGVLTIRHNLVPVDVDDDGYRESHLRMVHHTSSNKLSNQIVMTKSGLSHFIWDTYLQDEQYFDLSYNFIRKIFIISDGNLSGSQIVFNLTFNNCSFITIRIKNLQLSDNFTFLLDHNPFECDCKIDNIFAWKPYFQINFDFGDAVCSGPGHMKGRFLRDLNKGDLLCEIQECVMNCTCYERKHEQSILVNCSDGRRENFNTFSAELYFMAGMKGALLKVSLDLSNNLLSELPLTIGYETLEVTEILAANNRLENISFENTPDRLNYFDLRNNSFQILSEANILKLSTMKRVFLGDNPWHCDCSMIRLFKDSESFRGIVEDYDQLYCHNLGKRFKDLVPFDVCVDNVYFYALGGMVFGFIGVILGLFYKFKKDIKIFLYAHNMCLWFVSEEELDEGKIYDAFVCFAAPDQHLVDDLIIELENEHNGFRCVVGMRDWPPGEMFSQLVSQINEFSIT